MGMTHSEEDEAAKVVLAQGKDEKLLVDGVQAKQGNPSAGPGAGSGQKLVIDLDPVLKKLVEAWAMIKVSVPYTLPP